MALTVSPQIKLVALIGLVAALGFAGTMMFLGHRASSAPPVKTIIPLSQRHGAVAPLPVPAAKAPAKAKAPAAKTPAKTAAPAKTAPAVKHAEAAPAPAQAAPKPKATPKPKPPANPYNLPLELVGALAKHDTVVVSLYSPESKVDTIAYAEARAGAVAGHVGFVALSVLDPAKVRNLTEQLGVLSDPGILIYKRPGTLAARIDGFVDRDTVAQAAQDARLGS